MVQSTARSSHPVYKNKCSRNFQKLSKKTIRSFPLKTLHSIRLHLVFLQQLFLYESLGSKRINIRITKICTGSDAHGPKNFSHENFFFFQTILIFLQFFVTEDDITNMLEVTVLQFTSKVLHHRNRFENFLFISFQIFILNQLLTNFSPDSWFLLAKCLKNTCGRVTI